MEAMRRAVAGLSTLLIGLPAALPATLLAAFPVAGAWAQGTACPTCEIKLVPAPLGRVAPPVGATRAAGEPVA